MIRILLSLCLLMAWGSFAVTAPQPEDNKGVKKITAPKHTLVGKVSTIGGKGYPKYFLETKDKKYRMTASGISNKSFAKYVGKKVTASGTIRGEVFVVEQIQETK